MALLDAPSTRPTGTTPADQAIRARRQMIQAVRHLKATLEQMNSITVRAGGKAALLAELGADGADFEAAHETLRVAHNAVPGVVTVNPLV
jgi:hypothetical protein